MRICPVCQDTKLIQGSIDYGEGELRKVFIRCWHCAEPSFDQTLHGAIALASALATPSGHKHKEGGE